MKRNTHFIGVIILAFTIFAGCNSVTDSNSINSDQLNSSSIDESNASTAVPGHKGKYDKDDNGYPDAGKYVNGHYTALYAYDANGDWYWDLGDGRIQGTVGSIDDLDEATLTTCDYVNNYRADFNNDPFMDAGWIQNHINCSGYDDNGTYNYLIVHESDPRYRGNPDWAIWGTWEYHVLTESGQGNLVRPENHVGS